MPGLANAHTHIAMTLLRGWGSDLNLHDWLFTKIFPAEDRLTNEFVRTGSRLAFAELFRFGVTSIADMYFYMDQVAIAAKESGARASLARSVSVTSGPNGSLGLAQARSLIDDWNGAEDGRIIVAVSPHSEYTTSDELNRKLIALAREKNVPIHVHLSETRSETEECVKRHGLTPVMYYNSLGAFDSHVMAAHCIFVNDEDIDTLTAHGAMISHNPVSNLKLASGVMPLPKLLEKGALVALGTDGVASNNTHNLWEEIRLTGILHKGVSGDPTTISPLQVMKMATENGAVGMGFEDCGRLEKGKRADLIFINDAQPHYVPCEDVPSALVYSAQGSDVTLTMVNGRVVYKDGEYKTLDVERDMALTREYFHIMTAPSR